MRIRMSATQTRDRYGWEMQGIPSVERACDLLELLAYFRQELTLSELSRRLGIPKSTLHCLVSTLVTRGYLQRGKDGHHFSLGYRLSEFAVDFSVQSQLRTMCHPHMVAVVRKLDLTALLAVLVGLEAVTIASVESQHDNGGGAWIGRHIEVHCTAQGKALIAYHSDLELERLLLKHRPSIYTAKTMANLDALKAALREVRVNGYAVNDEEHVLGIRAVAAPIFDYTGSVVASLSLRAPTPRMPLSRLEHVGKEVASVAREISRHLRDPVGL